MSPESRFLSATAGRIAVFKGVWYLRATLKWVGSLTAQVRYGRKVRMYGSVLAGLGYPQLQVGMYGLVLVGWHPRPQGRYVSDSLVACWLTKSRAGEVVLTWTPPVLACWLTKSRAGAVVVVAVDVGALVGMMPAEIGALVVLLLQQVGVRVLEVIILIIIAIVAVVVVVAAGVLVVVVREESVVGLLGLVGREAAVVVLKAVVVVLEIVVVGHVVKFPALGDQVDRSGAAARTMPCIR